MNATYRGGCERCDDHCDLLATDDGAGGSAGTRAPAGADAQATGAVAGRRDRRQRRGDAGRHRHRDERGDRPGPHRRHRSRRLLLGAAPPARQVRGQGDAVRIQDDHPRRHHRRPSNPPRASTSSSRSAAVEENVTVSTEAPLVETSHATLGIVIDEKKIVELPLNGRNFTQLGIAAPRRHRGAGRRLGGASGDATPGGFGAATAGFSVNGQRNQSNNFLLDGASNNDTFNTGFVLRPPPDAIQEFKILTHSYSAEYGRNSGSVVNVVTRAGSNALHGAAWEFNRDDALQARNFFAPQTQPKPKLKQNQFGGSLGGPLPAEQDVRLRLLRGLSQHQRPDAEHRRGRATRSAHGNFGSTTIRDPLTGLPFANNTIPAERISPTAQRLLNEFVPRANNSGNRYIASPDATDDRDQMGLRWDYNICAQQLAARPLPAQRHRLGRRRRRRDRLAPWRRRRCRTPWCRTRTSSRRS